MTSEPSTQKLSVFLMFHGNAEEAMNYYTSLFEDGEVLQVIRARAEDAGWDEGALQYGIFQLAGQRLVCSNTPPPDSHLRDLMPWHEFRFTPAMTIYVQRDSVEDFDRLYAALTEGGEVHLPARDYGFSPRFAWVTDRYGVSWRIDLSAESAAA
ncbi:VOC family protein [Actinomadura sp. GC306]|uniref:VOC family protein n=1 Tax=Actinomadura sp. GC306 TaxID=2530367 RepID=UPI00105160FB|nr:VOC family protein [Actinomadura sp. GC306]TDC72072.1 VOC family protein [Actinomadura sp. GC306]